MNLIVYSDPGCQTKAYEITSPICTNATEVAVFCSNSIATVLNCNPNNWRLVQLNETELSVTVQSSKNCVPFAYAIENYNFRIYFNQECQADGWSEPHLGNMSTIDVGIPIIPTPQTSTTDSTGLYLIIGVTAASLVVLGLLFFLGWYVCVRRASKFRRKPSSEDGLMTFPVKEYVDSSPVVIKSMPIMESTITLANHQLFILPSDGEDYISSSSSRKSWQSPGGVLVEAPLLNDNLPRPSIDPYKAIPYFLPRESTDTYDYEDAINKPYPPYESRHFTSNVTPIAESSPGTVDGTLTATNAILSNLDISPNPTSLTWNSEKVSSTAFVNLYTSCLTSLTIPLRTTLTLPLVSSHKDIQKSFERGKMIRECIDLIDLEVDLEGDDRDLVYERLCGDERLGPLKVNILNHLTKSWRADQKSVPKIEIFVERCVKWWCMAGAVSGGLVCSSGDGFDPMRHTFEDGHGDKVYCLIPGLIRGDQIVFREIVSNCVLEEVSTCGERRSFDDTKGRLDPVPSDKRLSV